MSVTTSTSRDGVGSRFRLLVLGMLLLLVVVGAAGVIAVKVSTERINRLSNGITPATEAHRDSVLMMNDLQHLVRGYGQASDSELQASYGPLRNSALAALTAVAADLHAVGYHDLDRELSAELTLANAWLSTSADPVMGGRIGYPQPSDFVQRAARQLSDFSTQQQQVATELAAERTRLRGEAQHTRNVAIPTLLVVTAIAVVIAALIALRAATGITAPLADLWGVIGRLDRGDLSVRAKEDEGPSEVRALARAVNALIGRSRAELVAERDAEQFRQRTRLISSTIRRTTDGAQMANHLVRGLGSAFEVDRAWLHTFADERVTQLTAEWAREDLSAFPTLVARHVEANRALADRLWKATNVLAIDDLRQLRTTSASEESLRLAQSCGVGASLVVAIGDGHRAFGLLWLSMAAHSRHWSPAEVTVAQQLGADLAHGLVQAQLISRQAQAERLLAEFDQAKADFISSVSRELRTPLTSISGYVGLLKDGDAGPLPPDATQMLSIIDRNATHLRDLIEGLLTQTRLDLDEPVPLDVVGVDLHAVLGAEHDAMRPVAEAAGVSLEIIEVVEGVAGGVLIEADPEATEQVVTNLMSNAIKFTPPGGRVVVTMSLDVEGDGVVMEFTDTGIGVPRGEQDKLFTRFFRGSNAADAGLAGTGLGLATVHEIVQRHGGALDVDTDLDAGSTFTVWLPRTAPNRAS